MARGYQFMCEPTSNSHKPSTKKRCNCCGKSIEIVTQSGIHMDHLRITKKWGYFSHKDLSIHSFTVCETCYDQWIKTFKVPVEEEEVTEVFSGIEQI